MKKLKEASVVFTLLRMSDNQYIRFSHYVMEIGSEK